MKEKIIDKENLQSNAYIDSNNLSKRVALYEYTVPRYSVTEEVVRTLKIEGSESILDVGCGDGKLLINLRIGAGHKGPLVGLDISEGIVNEAAKNADSSNANIFFRKADVQSLPFPDEHFDVVTACHMIYHVQDVDKALKEMTRVLKPKGQFVLSANSVKSKIEVLRPLKEKVAKKFNLTSFPDTTVRFNIESGEELLQKYFKNLTLKIYKSDISVQSSDPYLAYFTTLRSLWNEEFSNEKWSLILKFVDCELNEIILRNGKLQESNIFGIFSGNKN